MLGALSETTGGSVLHVNPADLTKNFSTILTQTVVASLVSIRMLLHVAMRFENEPGATGNRLSKEIGNVTEDTQVRRRRLDLIGGWRGAAHVRP